MRMGRGYMENKHLQNICKSILESSTSRSYAVDVKTL